MKKNKIISALSIIIIFLFVIPTELHHKIWTKKNTVIYWDAISYYAYLPATFIYKDISLKFTKNYKGAHKFIFWPEKIKNGNLCIKTTMGLSIIFSPFFFIAHLYALNSHFDAGGYSMPYRLALVIGSLVWFLLGLIVLRKLLLKFFSDFVTAFIILIIALGTNLYFYVIFKPVMPHQFNFVFFIFFISLTISWYEKATLLKSILLGAVLGLISLIRPTDAIVVIFFIFYGITNFSTLKKRFSSFIKNYKYIIAIIIMILIVWLPQIIYWKYISGKYLFFSYTNDEHFFWSNPHILKGILGYRKGWLLYTPVMLFSLLGYIFLREKLKNFILPLVLIIPISLYIILSWWCWWYGGSFGMRPIIEYYAFLAFPLGALLDWTIRQKKLKKIIIISFISILSIFNLFETSQYIHGAIHWDAMTKKAYWNSFGRLYPSKELKYLIKRPDYDAAKKGFDKYIDN